MFKTAPKVRSQRFTEPFSCKLPIEVKELERKAKFLGLDVPEIARVALSVGLIEAIELCEKEKASEVDQAS